MATEYSDPGFKDRKRSAHWTDSDTDLLVQILLKHKDSSRTQDNGFKPEVWRETASALQPVTVLGGTKTAEACKSRWQRLQRDFKAAKDVQSVRGITWDRSQHKLAGAPEAWQEADRRMEPYKWQKIYLPWYDSFELLCPSSGQRPLLTRRQRGSVGSVSTMDTSMMSLSGSSTRDTQLRTPSQSSSTHAAMFSVSSSTSALSTPADEMMPETQQMMWDMVGAAQDGGINPMTLKGVSAQPFHPTMPLHGNVFASTAMPAQPPLPPNFVQQPPSSQTTSLISPAKRQKTWNESLRPTQRQTRSRQATHQYQPYPTPATLLPAQYIYHPGQQPNILFEPQSPTFGSGHGTPQHNQSPGAGSSTSGSVMHLDGMQILQQAESKPVLAADQSQNPQSHPASNAPPPETDVPYHILRAGYTDAQRRTEALMQLQDKEAYLGQASLLEVISEFEVNIAACDTYLAMKGDELRKQWIQRLLARRKRAGRS